MKKKYKTMIITLLIITLLALGGLIFVNQPQFGKVPDGERLERIKKSPNYRDGEFQNLSKTTVMTGDVNYLKVMKEFFFSKNKRRQPEKELPSKKVDLLNVEKDKDCLVWFGHSSYFMQIDGKKILVDPVLCGNASPVNFTTKSFKGSDVYSPDDIPEIDYLVITHDHWDHLDYRTLMKLKPRIKYVITSLGVGSHLEEWGFDKKMIFENDWYEESALDSGFLVTATPARHFSGRFLKRNQTLWSSFVLKTPNKKIFIGGDGGYDTHFKTIGDKFGPFDLAILECGQYNENWHYIHMMPEETVQASMDLKAKTLLPVHWAKFALGLHDWDEPIKRVVIEAEIKKIDITTPMIGEPIFLGGALPKGKWL